MRKSMLLLPLLLAALNVSAGQMYRWVDAEGKVHYTDTPPPPSAKQVEEKKLGNAGGDDVSSLPYAVQVAARKYPVTLYVTDCGEGCEKARSHLQKRGVPFVSKDPAKNEADRAALQQLTGKMEVPVLAVGNSISNGYRASDWDSLLDAAGYPKNAVLPKPPAAKTDKTEKAETKAAPNQ